MKTKSFILSVIMLVSFAGLSAQSKESNKKTVLFDVYMHCESCKNKIEKNIAFEKGVKNLDINLEKQTVSITYDGRKTDVEKLQEAFKKLGYEAKLPSAACCADKKKGGCTNEKKSCPVKDTSEN